MSYQSNCVVADTVDTEKSGSKWAPAWLQGKANGSGEKAVLGPVTPSPAASAPDGVADLRVRAERLIATFPESWRKDARHWLEPWGDRWSDLAEAGEAEGLTPREAEALAYDVFADQVPSTVRVQPEPGPSLADFDRAWSPTLHPAFPEMCRGRARVYAAKTKTAVKSKPAPESESTLDLQED